MDRTSQTIRLNDGRTLGFAEYGDSKGKPLFYFHGWPASHLSGQKYDVLGKKLHVRVIAPDRPGYGLSDYQNNRTLLDWPNDVLELADTVHIKKFSTLGASGGGPYAAVCAYKISQRIIRNGIAVGLSPAEGPNMYEGLTWLPKLGWMTYGRFPVARRVATFTQFINARYGPTWGIYGHMFGAKTDKEFYSDLPTRVLTKKIYQDAFRQGYKGPELDLKLYTTNWGFDLTDIRAKVYLWYGGEDQNVSISMGKYYKSHLQKSKLTIYPSEGHMISITHAEEILKTLTK